MRALVKTNGYINTKINRFLGVCIACLFLSGCFGGTVAQQLVRSIATSVADKAIANAMDVNEDAQQKSRRHVAFTSRQSDDMSYALKNMRFKQAPLKNSPVNTQADNTALSLPPPKKAQIIKESALVRVKVLNLIIGQEKNSLYEKARRIGALNLPSQQAWTNGHIAFGIIENTENPITVVIPAELGKPTSGSIIIVELANVGDLNIARYNDTQQNVYHAMDESNL
jgi:hypothetical protein